MGIAGTKEVDGSKTREEEKRVSRKASKREFQYILVYSSYLILPLSASYCYVSPSPGRNRTKRPTMTDTMRVTKMTTKTRDTKKATCPGDHDHVNLILSF